MLPATTGSKRCRPTALLLLALAPLLCRQTVAGMALTCGVSPATVNPGMPVTISGTATNLSTGEPVLAATGIVTLDGRTWTAPIFNGAYSRAVSAPWTGGTHRVSTQAADGAGATGSNGCTLAVQPDGSSADWRVEYFVTAPALVTNSYVMPSGNRSVFSARDVRVYAYVMFQDFRNRHKVSIRFSRPDGTTYGSPASSYMGTDGVTYPSMYYYSWLSVSNYTTVAGVEGLWKAGLFIDDVYVATACFTIRYEFARHRMARGALSGGSGSPVGPTSTFLQTNAYAYACSGLDNAADPVTVRWTFYDPGLRAYAEVTNASPDPGSGRWHASTNVNGALAIAGAPAASLCGTWRVEVRSQDPWNTWRLKYTDYFRLVECPSVNPVVSVSPSPSEPAPGEPVAVRVDASDNTRLEKVSLYWNDGGAHSESWVGQYTNTLSDVRQIGPFTNGQAVEIWATAWDSSGNTGESAHAMLTVGTETLSALEPPAGPAFLKAGATGTYATRGGLSSAGHPVEYTFSWGDGATSSWSTATNRQQAWPAEGSYPVLAWARCQLHPQIVASNGPLLVTVDGTPASLLVATDGGGGPGRDFATPSNLIFLTGSALDHGSPPSGLAAVSLNAGGTNEGSLTAWTFRVELQAGRNDLLVAARDRAGNVGTGGLVITHFSDGMDADDDHFSDWQEFVAGTCHTNGNHFFSISNFVGMPGTTRTVVSWQSVAGRRYTVYASTNLGSSWSNLYQVEGNGFALAHTNWGGATRFYRLGAELLP